MADKMHEIELEILKYTCDSCSKPFYYHYFEITSKCPHCGNECSKDTMDNYEEINEIILYSIDPKSGKISIYE